jgi:hypothetical protein
MSKDLLCEKCGAKLESEPQKADHMRNEHGEGQQQQPQA